MNTSVCAALLKESMGLDVAAVGPWAIEHAVRQRMAASLQPDIDAYERYLSGSATELQALIEAAVVPETWFFRDRQAFVEMVRALEGTSRRAGPEPLRLLSLPCSTGEEPYSMAMALLDAGFASGDFRIDAIDISARALAHAGRAVYGRNSFRGTDLDFRDRYFESTPAGHRLSDAVRGFVHFTQGNVFASGVLPQFALYDIIFCRNLLVYFDRPEQTRAIEKLGGLLRDDGTMFVGPAEATMMFDHGFVWSKVPLAFAFTKRRALPGAGPQRAAPLPRGRRPALATHPSTPVRVAPAARAVAPAPVRGNEADLVEAGALADAGRFAEAAAICQKHLQAHGSSVTAYHLMGVIRDAAGDTAEAVRNFKKALYLDAGHAESLAHLALLEEKRGDHRAARLLRERLQRQRIVLGAATC